MTISPDEHFHALLLALHDQDRDEALILLVELVTWLVVPGNRLPQPRTTRVTDEGLDLAGQLLREGATRKRAQAADVPSIADESTRQAAALDRLADALASTGPLVDIVLVR